MDYHSAILSVYNYLTYVLLAINLQGTTFLIILLIALLLLVFTISGAEVALFSLTARDINVLKTKQHSAAKRIINLLEERKTVYTSMLIANTFFNICIILLSNFLITEFVPLENLFHGLDGFGIYLTRGLGSGTVNLRARRSVHMPKRLGHLAAVGVLDAEKDNFHGKV